MGKPDRVKPSVTITFPLEGGVYDYDNLIVKGNSSDNVAIKTTQIRVDGGSWIPVGSAGSWWVELGNLSPGNHTTDTS